MICFWNLSSNVAAIFLSTWNGNCQSCIRICDIGKRDHIWVLNLARRKWKSWETLKDHQISGRRKWKVEIRLIVVSIRGSQWFRSSIKSKCVSILTGHIYKTTNITLGNNTHQFSRSKPTMQFTNTNQLFFTNKF